MDKIFKVDQERIKLLIENKKLKSEVESLKGDIITMSRQRNESDESVKFSLQKQAKLQKEIDTVKSDIKVVMDVCKDKDKEVETLKEQKEDLRLDNVHGDQLLKILQSHIDRAIPLLNDLNKLGTGRLDFEKLDIALKILEGEK